PFRGATVSGRSVSGAGITFFRIYRHEIAKDKVEVHENRRGLVLLRRFMASDGSGGRSLHAADDRPEPRCRAHPRPPDGDPGTVGLVSMVGADRQRGRSSTGAAGGLLEGRTGPVAPKFSPPRGDEIGLPTTRPLSYGTTCRHAVGQFGTYG